MLVRRPRLHERKQVEDNGVGFASALGWQRLPAAQAQPKDERGHVPLAPPQVSLSPLETFRGRPSSVDVVRVRDRPTSRRRTGWPGSPSPAGALIGGTRVSSSRRSARSTCWNRAGTFFTIYHGEKLRAICHQPTRDRSTWLHPSQDGTIHVPTCPLAAASGTVPVTRRANRIQ